MKEPITPWQVWHVDFDPQVGSEQYGKRPAIVVGSSLMCDTVGRRLALVVPCTGTDRDLPWQPKIQLKKPSVVMVEQIKSVSRERLLYLHRYEVPPDVRQQIRQALANLIAR